jgi:DNA-binding Xre family transcriptional regulator
MSSVRINFNALLIKNRLTLTSLSEKTGIPYSTIHSFYKRGTIKNDILGKMEEKLNTDLSEFIIKPTEGSA